MSDPLPSSAPQPASTPAAVNARPRVPEAERVRVSDPPTWPGWFFAVLGFALAAVIFRDGWPSFGGDAEAEAEVALVADARSEELRAMLEREMQANLDTVYRMYGDLHAGPVAPRDDAERRQAAIHCHGFVDTFRPGVVNGALARLYVDEPAGAEEIERRWRTTAVQACLGQKPRAE